MTVRTKDALCILILLGLFGAAIAAWPDAPERFPIHWSTAEPDWFASMAVGLLLVPCVALAAFGFVRIISTLPALRHLAERLATLRLVTVVMHAAVYVAVLAAARGVPLSPIVVSGGILGALFIIVGASAHGVQQNWVIGVRTPWTLRSERVWRKTHRVAGPVFIVLGLAVLGLYALRPHTHPLFIVALLVAVTIGLTGLSLLFWLREKRRGDGGEESVSLNLDDRRGGPAG